MRDGMADVLMKGLINTDNLLRAVLNKEHGILARGNVLTHITAANICKLLQSQYYSLFKIRQS